MMKAFRDQFLTAFALAMLLIYTVLVALPAVRVHTHGFASYYTAAYLLLYEPQQMGRLYDNAWFSSRIVDLGFVNVRDIFNVQMPTMSLLMVPLAWLHPDTARLLWTLLGLVWLVTGLALLMSALGLSPWRGLWVLPLCLAYAPITQNIRYGQAYLMLLFLTCALFWLMLRGTENSGPRSDRWAGLILALLLILKSAVMWLWPLLLLTGRRRVVFWGLLSATGIVLVSLPRISLVAWQTYLREIPAFLEAPSRYVTGYQTVTSLIGHLTVYDETFNPHPVVNWPFLARLLPPLLLLVVLACSVYLSQLTKAGFEARALTLALFLAPAVANAPVGEGYHYTLILPAIIIACWWAWQAHIGWLAWGVLAIAVFLLGAPLPYQVEPLKVSWMALLAYPRVYGAYLLWGWLGWALVSVSTTEPVSAPSKPLYAALKGTFEHWKGSR